MTIVNDYPYNAQKHRLGKLCKRQHDWLGTGQSLRWISTGSCCICERDRLAKQSEAKRKNKEVTEVITIEDFDFSSGLHRLGKLCQRKHMYRDSGLSVRLLSNNQCYHCRKDFWQEYQEVRKKDRVENPEKYRLASSDYYKRNKEKRDRSSTEFRRRMVATSVGREKVASYNKAYRQKNSERIKTLQSSYRRSPKGRLIDYLKRHRRRACRSEKYSAIELQNKYDIFAHCCAYCWSKEKLTIEHVIPLSDVRGWDRLNNVIPACPSCNFAKQNAPMLTWYGKQPFFSQERLWKILNNLGESEINTLEQDLLDPLGVKSHKRSASTEASLQQFHQDASGT